MKVGIGEPDSVQAVDEGEEVGGGDLAGRQGLAGALVGRVVGGVVVCCRGGGEGGRVGAREGTVDSAVEGVRCFW